MTSDGVRPFVRVVGVDWWFDLRYREKSFSGKVAVEVEDPPDPLVVDSSRLAITSASVDGRAADYREDAAQGTLEFPGLPPGHHRLEIEYRGAADENSLVGLYASPAGSGYYLTTMLFPTGSRRILPSFEAPAVKTVYRLVLTVDPDVTAIFNTAPRSERTVDGRREVTYEPTPPMSAYLLYLGVGPFDTIVLPHDRWSVTVAASPGRATAGRHSGERAAQLLAAYEEYYGIPYPLPKLDLVALENFWAGAMENWGAIAFRENLVLVDPSTTVAERRVALMILAHEVAHQWFGNLVTPARWDDFWLNESFATFVGFRIVSHRFPEENPWPYLLVRWVAEALDQDALAATHPVKVPVDSPETLGEISDEVTYGKGAAVLRMVEAYLGEETFRKGVAAYLTKHRYGSARAEDLWSSLGEVSDRPVGRLMTEWITRPGYPLVRASWDEGTLLLRQERFYADGTTEPATWPVPLRVASLDGESLTLFEQPEMRLPIRSREGLRVDPGRTVFARVHYDESLFGSVVTDFPSMAPVDQWGLVVDTHAFLYAGLVSLAQFVELLRAGASATDELPVSAFLSVIGDLHRPLFDVPLFDAETRRFLRGQLTVVGLDPQPNEPEYRSLLRGVLAETLVQFDLGFARELASRYPEVDQQVPELRRPVTVAFAVSEGAAAFDPLVARLRSTDREAERIHVLRALAQFREPGLLRESLELIPSPGVTSSTSVYLVYPISRNPMGGRVLFDWYRERAADLSKMWAGTPILSTSLKLILSGMGVDFEPEVNDYFADHTPPEAVLGAKLGLESLRLAVRLRRRALGIEAR